MGNIMQDIRAITDPSEPSQRANAQRAIGNRARLDRNEDEKCGQQINRAQSPGESPCRLLVIMRKDVPTRRSNCSDNESADRDRKSNSCESQQRLRVWAAQPKCKQTSEE